MFLIEKSKIHFSPNYIPYPSRLQSDRGETLPQNSNHHCSTFQTVTNSKVSHRSKFSPEGTKRQNDDDDLPDVDGDETVGSLRFKLVASHRPPLPRTILESSIRERLSLPRPRLFFASSPLSFSSLVHSLNFTDPPFLSLLSPAVSKGGKIRYTSDPRSRFGRTRCDELVLESF